jgi:hypothetical protein
VTSWGSPALNIASLGGVATLGVGLSASCLAAFLGSSAQNMASCVGVATPIVGALVLGSYVSCRMSSRGSRIVEYYRKIIPKPKILTETRTQDSFGFVTLVPVISSPKRTNFVLAQFFSRA